MQGTRRLLDEVPAQEKIRNPELLERRRREILDAALELFLEKGFKATTVRDICQRSGISHASIYDYVANKDDILRRLLHRMFQPDKESSLDRALAGGYAGPEGFLDDLFAYSWGANREAILLVYRVIGDLSHEDRRAVLGRDAALAGGIERYLRRETGLADDDPRLAVIANLIVFLNAFMPFRDWYTRDLDDDDLVRRTVVDGVTAMIRQLADTPR